MKRISYIFFLLIFPSFLFLSCEDMLDVDSGKFVIVDDNAMQADSLYSMFGILYELQKIADSYVILGELRGELLETSTSAGKYLREIYQFDDYSAENPYTNNKGDYYAIINNCNYVIHNVDTAKMYKGTKPMHKIVAAATAIKAWTYMQLVLNFGEAYYFDKPILSIREGMKNNTPLQMEALFPKLIEELLPYKDVERLRPGEFGEFDETSVLFFSIPFLLGDLYLWTGQNENAANFYRDLIYHDAYTVTSWYQSIRGVDGSGTTMEFSGTIYSNWQMIFTGKTSTEYITTIAASNEYEHLTYIDRLLYSPTATTIEQRGTLIPTELALSKFDSTFYFHGYKSKDEALTTYGDLRKSGTFVSHGTGSLTSNEIITHYYVNKYYRMNYYDIDDYPEYGGTESNIILPYRVALLYLRYAESVNRLGKPNLAMAVLKHGLNYRTLSNRKIIPESEIPDPLPNYMDFKASRFDDNIGIHSRGAGNSEIDTTFYKINLNDIQNPTLKDSILYVENLIQEELVLELAYEGNRFHDLMRFAIYREDNAYLADIVAEKYKDAGLKERVRNKLNFRENWYIKK